MLYSIFLEFTYKYNMYVLYLIVYFVHRPRRRRQSSLDTASPVFSLSCDQLSVGSASKTTSPMKSLHSLPERLSESSDNLDFNDAEVTSRRCRSCEGMLDADEQSHSLHAPVEAATQTKRKKNFMDRCVNKVRLCWWLVDGWCNNMLAVCACLYYGCLIGLIAYLCESYFKVQKCAQLCIYLCMLMLKIIIFVLVIHNYRPAIYPLLIGSISICIKHSDIVLFL